MPETTTPATIRVLSAGAPKTGVRACAEAFSRETGHEIALTFATAPVLRGKVEEGTAAAEIVVAPVPAMKDFEQKGLTVAGIGAVLGSVKAGVAVREGAPAPDLSSAQTFKNAVLAAESLVYNEASSGLYIAQLMARLGIAEAVEAKTLRLATGAAVLRHIAGSDAVSEIGFGQIPEIRRFVGQGVRLVGPLPEEIGKVTTYAVGLLADARAREPARDFIQFLASASAMLRDAGIE